MCYSQSRSLNNRLHNSPLNSQFTIFKAEHGNCLAHPRCKKDLTFLLLSDFSRDKNVIWNCSPVFALLCWKWLEICLFICCWFLSKPSNSNSSYFLALKSPSVKIVHTVESLYNIFRNMKGVLLILYKAIPLIHASECYTDWL